MIPIIVEHPNMAFESVLTSINLRNRTKEEIFAPIDYLIEKYREIGRSKEPVKVAHWIMGQLQTQAVGNIPLTELRKQVEKRVNNFK